MISQNFGNQISDIVSNKESFSGAFSSVFHSIKRNKGRSIKVAELHPTNKQTKMRKDKENKLKKIWNQFKWK